MHADGPLAPTQHEWAWLGYSNAEELGDGKQSRVYSASSEVGPVVVKLTDASLVEIDLLEKRTAIVSDLAHLDNSVVAPVRVRERFVYEFGGWFVSATELIDGKPLNPARAADGELMGASLAALHSSMRRVSDVSLPEVAALRAGHGPPWPGSTPHQLLHGDFNSSNLLLSAAGIRIFDFDESGHGPVEFDVANALYMVLFDAVVNHASTKTYDDFRAPFVGGYEHEAQRSLTNRTIDALIDLRVRALDYWTTNLRDAPVGIRTSSPEWIATLRQFVDDWTPLGR